MTEVPTNHRVRMRSLVLNPFWIREKSVLVCIKCNSILNYVKRRYLSIHEYQSMKMLRDYGIPSSKGITVKDVSEVEEAIRKLESKELVVKAQVLAGGRGKGVFESGLQGGVQLVQGSERIKEVVGQMLGKRLRTKQTGSEVKKEDIIGERYLALTLSRESKGIVLIGSGFGGMDIEKIAKDNPKSIITLPLPADNKVSLEEIEGFGKQIGIGKDQLKEFCTMVERLKTLMIEKDATLIEINPLCKLKSGELVCLDAKLNFDDNAEFRQKDLFSLRDVTQEDPRETKAAKYNLNYIGLDGTIGCLVNGAGLAMATMDIIKLKGGSPANFLDVGGSATAEQVEQAIKILQEDPAVKTILINIFGGIMRCDIIAEGIINSLNGGQLNVPLVVRLLGTNVEIARDMLNKYGNRVQFCNDLDDAANKAVNLAK